MLILSVFSTYNLYVKLVKISLLPVLNDADELLKIIILRHRSIFEPSKRRLHDSGVVLLRTV